MATSGPLGSIPSLQLQLQAARAGYFDISSDEFQLMDLAFCVNPRMSKKLRFRGRYGMPRPGVYLIAMNAIGEYYVGQTSNLGRRMAQHRRRNKSVRQALLREMVAPKSPAYAGVELITFEGWYTFLPYHDVSRGAVQPYSILDPREQHDRLAMEGAVLLAVRNLFPGGKALNAVDRSED